MFQMVLKLPQTLLGLDAMRAGKSNWPLKASCSRTKRQMYQDRVLNTVGMPFQTDTLFYLFAKILVSEISLAPIPIKLCGNDGNRSNFTLLYTNMTAQSNREFHSFKFLGVEKM